MEGQGSVSFLLFLWGRWGVHSIPFTDSHQPRIYRLEVVGLVIVTLGCKLVVVPNLHLAVVPSGPYSPGAMSRPDLYMGHVVSLLFT